MRRLLGIGGVVLGIVGVLFCAAVVGIGWWAAVRTTDRLHRVAARLDQGMSEVDGQLARVESRVNDILKEVEAIREAAEKIADDNPELPRVQAEIARLLERLVPTLQRADALADSLRSAAEALHTAADVAEQLTDESAVPDRVRAAADRIHRAAASLNDVRARVESSKAAKAVQWTRELAALAREAIAGSEQLSKGLLAARQEIAVAREGTDDWFNKVVFWTYMAATANTLAWLWGGLGQLCLIGWGRRRVAVQVAILARA